MAWPVRQEDPHYSSDKVEPPERPIFLARRARTVALPGHALDVCPHLFLGRVVHLRDNGGRQRNPAGGVLNDPHPHVPASLVEGATQKDIEEREGLDGGSAREPQTGGDRVALHTR